MSFHIVSKQNNRFRPGTWFECLDDGCREVQVETVNNRMKVVKEVGLVMPKGEIDPYITSVMKRGVRRHG